MVRDRGRRIVVGERSPVVEKGILVVWAIPSAGRRIKEPRSLLLTTVTQASNVPTDTTEIANRWFPIAVLFFLLPVAGWFDLLAWLASDNSTGFVLTVESPGWRSEVLNIDANLRKRAAGLWVADLWSGCWYLKTRPVNGALVVHPVCRRPRIGSAVYA